MKTAELEGDLLDYWTGRATGALNKGAGALLANGRPYFPSRDWVTGGPLIEEYKVGVWPGTEARPLSQLWSANIPDEGGCFDDAREQVGFTPLEAACRAIVASKFGEEVSDV